MGATFRLGVSGGHKTSSVITTDAKIPLLAAKLNGDLSWSFSMEHDIRRGEVGGGGGGLVASVSSHLNNSTIHRLGVGEGGGGGGPM